MKKLYRIIILLVVLTFLTTYNPKEFHIFSKKKNFFFKVQNIEVINNHLVNKNNIIEKLTHIYEKNILFIKSDDIEAFLKSINFLEKIEVKKKYPNTIIIKIYETKPVAILFKKNDKYLVLPLNNMPSGFVSNILIVIVSGYFFLTSIFSKKLTFCSDSSISRLLIRKIFLSYILFNFSKI